MISRTLHAGLRLLAAVAVAWTAVACSVNPATGERQLTLISESQEIEMGREADQQISAQLGHPAHNGLVRRVPDELHPNRVVLEFAFGATIAAHDKSVPAGLSEM